MHMTDKRLVERKLSAEKAWSPGQVLEESSRQSEIPIWDLRGRNFIGLNHENLGVYLLKQQYYFS